MISKKGNELMGHIPSFYQTSRVMNNTQDVIGLEHDDFIKALNETLDQFYIDTTTWAIDRWEDELGLEINETLPIEQRRDRVKSRQRGYGTATIYLVKDVAGAYDKGDIEIAQDHNTFNVRIFFVDTTGIPPNLDDMKKAIRTVVPAHFTIDYEFNYFTYDELDSKSWTYDDLDAKNLTYDELEVYG